MEYGQAQLVTEPKPHNRSNMGRFWRFVGFSMLAGSAYLGLDTLAMGAASADGGPTTTQNWGEHETTTTQPCHTTTTTTKAPATTSTTEASTTTTTEAPATTTTEAPTTTTEALTSPTVPVSVSTTTSPALTTNTIESSTPTVTPVAPIYPVTPVAVSSAPLAPTAQASQPEGLATTGGSIATETESAIGLGLIGSLLLASGTKRSHRWRHKLFSIGRSGQHFKKY